MANTATVYDVTAKEYLHLGKVGKDWFGEIHGKEKVLLAFLCRIRYGHDIRLVYDSNDAPEGFYDGVDEDSNEYTLWKEIKP